MGHFPRRAEHRALFDPSPPAVLQPAVEPQLAKMKPGHLPGEQTSSTWQQAPKCLPVLAAHPDTGPEFADDP